MAQYTYGLNSKLTAASAEAKALAKHRPVFTTQATSLEQVLEYDPNLLEYDAWPNGQDTDYTITIARCKDSGIVETYAIAGTMAENPGFMAFCQGAMHGIHANRPKTWDWFEAISHYQNDEANSKLAKAKREHAQSKLPAPKRIPRNTEHEQAGILIHEECIVTCEETGISFPVRLPMPLRTYRALNLPTVHPLSFPDNVRSLMYHYSKAGIPIERELERQVLAGIFLSVLRSKGLLVCRDAQKANAFLQAASLNTLGYAIRWFYYKTSVQGFVGLSMDMADSSRLQERLAYSGIPESQWAEKLAETFIWNYIKACSGESLAEEQAHITLQPSRKDTKGKFKVYTDSAVQQDKQAKRAAAEATNALNALVSRYPSEHGLLFKQVRDILKMLIMSNPQVRFKLADRLIGILPQDEDAKVIAHVLRTVKQDAAEDELMSFSQQIAQELEIKQAASIQNETNSPAKLVRPKVDFMSIVNKAIEAQRKG